MHANIVYDFNYTIYFSLKIMVFNQRLLGFWMRTINKCLVEIIYTQIVGKVLLSFETNQRNQTIVLGLREDWASVFHSFIHS